jgi:hypothetical protein
MNNYIIPTTVIDNFFEDPMLVRNFALKQSYHKDKNNNWPGERSESIVNLDKNFFGNTINKFLRLFYDLDKTEVSWLAKAFFQKVDSKYNKGWVHQDRTAMISGIIYLNDIYVPNTGTTIYHSSIVGERMLHVDKTAESFNYPEKTKELEHYREENNNQFEESVVVKNRFNRLIAFDSHLYHAASDFVRNDDTRLTMVFFIDKLYANPYPIQRMRQA